ncbi:hypothetical protein Afil01_57850 [Actinorhabdospora filicis]|uniref:Helix-hairpin-helix domain-containing protein n=1 Tax=Actinorhabdospora filicis TaxID=1785913 RepID=A0A9W6WCD7_9ACTN|nr:helix-hairpin-helix domain-containing protein [Actinorhabdospora filicis]GLZ80978.1 hypothetical protein Afil01_57850 [Actinorhabdospora filicis]
MRILVLGTGPGAASARQFAHARGLALARHALDQVGYIVTDDTVNPRDPKLVAAKALGMRVMDDTEFVNQPEGMLLPQPHEGHLVPRQRGHHPHPRPTVVDDALRALGDAARRADGNAVRNVLRQLFSVLWAISPLITGGLSTPIIFGHAAAKLKSVLLGICTAVYGGILLGVLILGGIMGGDLINGGRVQPNPFIIAGVFAIVFGGTAHAFAIRKKVFAPDKAEPQPARRVPTDDVEARALARRERRQRAREIATEDPALADELGIGRPDLRTGYDDGGLIDVNAVPAGVLAEMRGVDEATAERIVEIRALSGPFTSTEDLIVRADLDPASQRIVEEYALYRS